jgi:hypothetical protein
VAAQGKRQQVRESWRLADQSLPDRGKLGRGRKWKIASNGGRAKDGHVRAGKIGGLAAFGKQDEERSCALQKTQSVEKRATTQSVAPGNAPKVATFARESSAGWPAWLQAALP